MKSTQAPKKPRTHSGNMTPKEIKPLIMAARAAHRRQIELGITEEDFDTWRSNQVMEAVGQTGLTKCNHGDYRPLMAHFKILSGDDAGAFKDLMKTGPARGNGDLTDSHEERRIIAHHIAKAIQEHQATGGKLGIGYVVTIARHKTRRLNLTLNGDLRADLADRCTVAQLQQIRSTVINRIAAAEGRGDSSERNQKQRSTKPRPTQPAEELQPRFRLPS